ADRLQSKAYSARHATARLDAGASGSSAPRAPAPWPDPAAGGESTLVLRCLLDPVLEWRGRLRGVCHRLSRSRGTSLRRVAAAADGRRHPHANGPDAVGAVRRDRAQSAARDSMALGQPPTVHTDGDGALPA